MNIIQSEIKDKSLTEIQKLKLQMRDKTKADKDILE